jgi:DNA-binding response OmpR family regulator
MEILVVEDEQKVAAFLKNGLEENGYSVDLAGDSQTGEKLGLSKKYHLLIIDVILPGSNGFVLCKRIKSSLPDVPVIMLTALGTTEDKLKGFDAGADDYLVKPFEFKELLARIKALTRRSHGFSIDRMSNEILEAADLRLDIGKKLAMRGNKTISLTAKEFGLLEFLMRNKGRVLSRLDIAEKVWDLNFDTGTNVVDVYINILRKKVDRDFEPKLIHTRVGLGYLIQDKA